jgi:hypothetical protein
MVVFFPVFPAKDFCFKQAGEELHVEELVTEPAIEALDVWILPRGTRIDEDR